MRYIYSQARLVWIWLGEGIDEIETAFIFLSGLSGHPLSDQKDCINYIKSYQLFKSMSH
jgi:hypothetical protein